MAAIADAAQSLPFQEPSPVQSLGRLRGARLALFDPDRRPTGKRSLRPSDWAPTLDETLAQCELLDGGCVKLAPGLDVEALEVRGHRVEAIPGCRLSWVSVDGEMKELNLWLGALGSDLDGGDHSRLAVRRTRGGDRVEHSGPRGYADEIEPGVPCEGDWLVELDVALWQSGLAAGFAAGRGFVALEPGLQGGFLASKSLPEAHGMVRAWQIKALAPADPKRVRAMLRGQKETAGEPAGETAGGASQGTSAAAKGPMTVKTRGIRESAEALAAKFGAHRALIAVSPVQGKRTALLLEPQG